MEPKVKKKMKELKITLKSLYGELLFIKTRLDKIVDRQDRALSDINSVMSKIAVKLDNVNSRMLANQTGIDNVYNEFYKNLRVLDKFQVVTREHLIKIGDESIES